MKISIKHAVAAFVFAVPLAASAQGNDAAYCQALSDKYRTYVANMTSGRSPMPEPADVKVAAEQCKSGNPAAGIAVLEQKLHNAKISLPPRG